MSRLLIPRPQSGSAVRRDRSRVPAVARPRRVQQDAAQQCGGRSALLRQNAAAMIVEAQLKAVWNRSLAAISYVNLYFHWDFREFNIYERK
jgi:hypothetical protein